VAAFLAAGVVGIAVLYLAWVLIAPWLTRQ
jgi:hypothetical protein